MAGQYDGGILSGMLAGWRMGQQDADQQKELAYQRQRRGVTDAQQDAAHGENMRGAGLRNAMAQHQIDRAPVMDAQQDAVHAEQMTGFGLRNAISRGELGRMPATFKMQDEQHAARLAADRRAAHAADMQAQLMRLGIDEKKLASKVARNNALMSQAYTYGKESGDWSALVDGFNAGPGADLGVKVAKIVATEDGKIIATTADGQEMPFGDVEKLGQTVAAYADPDVYRQSLVAALSGRNAEPANIREARMLADWQANGNEAALRAYEQVRTGRPGGAFDDVDFGRQGRPREQPAAAIPEQAVAYLRANPNMRAAFDAKYGAGASASVLGR